MTCWFLPLSRGGGIVRVFNPHAPDQRTLVRALFATAFVALQHAYNLLRKLFTLETRAKTFYKSFTKR